MKPVIGIIVCGLMDDRQFVTNAYIQSIKYAKGVPLLLPLVRSDEALQTYCSLCDGFLFCGGNDITPLLFGKEPAKGLGGNQHHTGYFSTSPSARHSKNKKAPACHLPWNAGLKCSLWRNASPRYRYLTPRTHQSYAAFRL